MQHFEKGETIKYLDELWNSDNILIEDEIVTKKVFSDWKIWFAKYLLETSRVFKAVKIIQTEED
jgi:hypothetical protein